MGSIRQAPSGRWQARYRDPNGREREKSFKRKADAQNFVTEVEGGKLREHRREDLITRMLPVTYDVATEAPRFRAFVEWAMGGEPEMVAFLQRWCGYTMRFKRWPPS